MVFSNIIHDREAEDKAYEAIGKTIAAAGDHQAFLYLKDHQIEEGESFNALRATLKKFADQVVFKFLNEDKLGRQIALRTHYKPEPVTYAQLATTAVELRAQLEAYDDTRFSSHELTAAFINDFESRAQGITQQISWAAKNAKPISAAYMGM